MSYYSHLQLSVSWKCLNGLRPYSSQRSRGCVYVLVVLNLEKGVLGVVSFIMY